MASDSDAAEVDYLLGENSEIMSAFSGTLLKPLIFFRENFCYQSEDILSCG